MGEVSTFISPAVHWLQKERLFSDFIVTGIGGKNWFWIPHSLILGAGIEWSIGHLYLCIWNHEKYIFRSVGKVIYFSDGDLSVDHFSHIPCIVMFYLVKYMCIAKSIGFVHSYVEWNVKFTFVPVYVGRSNRWSVCYLFVSLFVI